MTLAHESTMTSEGFEASPPILQSDETTSKSRLQEIDLATEARIGPRSKAPAPKVV